MSPARQVSRVMLVGDSLIEYGDWPGLLPDQQVVNLGRSGETVEGLCERAGNIVRYQAEPDG